MNTGSKLLIVAMMSLGACAEMPVATDTTAPRSNVPEEVRAVAAPGQDLSTVVFLESDNCYWYEYQGPVETTLLPLRTARGNAICAEAPVAPVPAT